MARTVAFHSLGCKVNSYESEVMARSFLAQGFEIVPFHGIADVYVVNTCSVTNIADRKSRQMLHQARRRNPDAVVVAVGCYVETDTEKVRADEKVDLAVGNVDKTRVAEHVVEFLRGVYEEQTSSVPDSPSAPSSPDQTLLRTGGYSQGLGLDSAATTSQNPPAPLTPRDDTHHISATGMEHKSVRGLDSAAYKSQDVPDEDTLTYDADVTGGLSHLSPASQGDWGTVPSVTSVSPDTETAHHSSGALVAEEGVTEGTVPSVTRTRAFVKIQDGCNLFCSYCIIPYARGRNRSRSVDEIVEEVRAVAATGIREVVLTGIHISSYGTDKSWGVDEVSSLQAHAAHDTPSAPSSPDQTLLRTEGYSQGLGLDSAAYKSQPAPANMQRVTVPVPADSSSPLLYLLEQIHDIDGIERIRLSSLEPRIVTDEFAAGLSALPKVCPHFHLSLQSGDNATLMRMRRHYTAGEYRRSVNALRRVYENPAITTDIIVGFPGETQEQFARTLSFAKEIRFYEIHVFPYSKRKGTAAASFEGQLTNAVKKERASALLALTAEQSKAYRAQFVHQPLRVLFEDTEQIDGHTYLIGNTERYVRVAYDVTGLSQEEIDALSGTFFEGVATCFLNDETLLFG